jgi:hypothetical protein
MGKTITIQSNHSDSQQSTPWAHVVVLPFFNPKVFKSSEKAKPVERYQEVMNTGELNINSDILSLDVSESKASFSNVANITLAYSNVNYSEALHAGDHILVWMGNNSESHTELINNLANKKKCNGANSGLKFIGKIVSVRASMITQATGIKQVRYSISASGFTELGATIYYNPVLSGNLNNSKAVSNSVAYLREVSSLYSNLIYDTNDESESSQGFIRFFINVFLGSGPDKTEVDGHAVTTNRGFFIPTRLYNILTGENISTASYTDILHRIIGRQKYTDKNYYPNKTNEKVVSLKKNEFMCDKLYGGLIGSPKIFESTIWSLIQSYRNPEINEAYAATKLNQNGDIFPHFIARQIPFTTDSFESNSLGFTLYSSLPSWKISNNWPVFSFNIGTSDASRFNTFVVFPHLSGLDYSGTNIVDPQIRSAMLNLMDVNDGDIFRHGPRSKTVNVYSTSKDKIPEEAWTKLISDFYLNGHLKYNGTIDMAGIQDPICIGDNAIISNKLFHIEQVNHRYMQLENGPRSFVTSLAISRGVGLESQQDSKLSVGSTTESGSNG